MLRATSRQRWAVGVVFALNGAVYGTWASRIPAVKSNLGLSESELGFTLLAYAGGAMLAMPLVGASIRRFGGYRVCRAMAPVFASALLLPGHASGGLALAGTVSVLGAANGSVDVAMNANGAAVQRGLGRNIMQSLHGGFSVGLACGGLAGAAAAGANISVATHFAVAAVVLGAVALTAVHYMLPDTPDPIRSGPGYGHPSAHSQGQNGSRRRGVAVATGLAVSGAFVEIALAEWAGIYLGESLHASAGVAASGFAVLSVAMTIGRLGGDPLADRFGLGPVIVGGFAAAVALATALLVANVGLMLVGLAICGFGIAGAFPAAISSADRLSGSHGITVVSAAAYALGLVAPAVLGLVARATTLGTALGIVVVGAVLIGGLAHKLQRRVELTRDGFITELST